ncbi:MAG TPA: YVTN family beta-propeller repeat-containing protein, partial [Spirochaetota bacterium]|nr:YVTN family beta-propeller repeat-containing protein [Spirochaetota bacterium]
LFVSSRGPNDPESYLNRSPENGRITTIDVEKQEIINVFEGGNQPTGLDVSNNGKYLCFSNFRDKNIEIYYLDNN